MRLHNFQRLLLSASLLTLFSLSVSAQGNFVYINNNPGVVNAPAPNTVSGFSVSPSGALTPVPGSPFATRGTGTGAGLFSGNRATISMVGNRLYVANQGSNDVSGFDINPATGELTPVPGSPFATGGTAGGNGISLDCTADGKFLIASNAGSADITVFSIASNGALTPVAGSPFPAGDINPIGIRVIGQFVAVPLREADSVAMFSIEANGALTPVPGSPFAAPANGLAIGAETNCAGNLLFVASASTSGTQVDVFDIAANGALTPVAGAPFNFPGVGSNSNVVLLSPDGRFLFVSNQNSNTITVFNVAANGSLTLVAGSPFANPGGALPQHMATDKSGSLLYVTNSNGALTIFNIGADGSLSPVAGSPVAVGSSPRPGLAAYPAAVAGGGAFVCPEDITVSNAPGQCGAFVNYPPITSSGCGVVTCDPPSGSFFAVGVTMVTCSSGSTQCSFQVTVNNTVAPVLSCGVTKSVLWIADNSLVNVGLSANVSDDCGDAPQVTVKVYSDEDDEDALCGGPSPDAKYIAPGTLKLRAERKLLGNGRVYLIVVKAVDSSGNESICVQTVVVPGGLLWLGLDSVNAQAAAAKAYALANGGAPPPGYFVVGDGPNH